MRISNSTCYGDAVGRQGDSGESILCLTENVKTKKYSTLLIQEIRHSYEETAIYEGTEYGRKAMEDDRKL